MLHDSSALPGRRVCYRCHKPASVCICAAVPRVFNRTQIRILQHPRERFHPLGTVRFARLGLSNTRIVVEHPDEHSELKEKLLAGPERVALLYPSSRARRMAELPAAARPEALIVLDGTWSHARVLYRAHPWLEEVPHVAVTPPGQSLYRIRPEPFLEAVSTLEAVVLALRILEPDLSGLDQLLSAFVGMIDRQIELAASRVGRTRNPKIRRERRAIPPELRLPLERLVLIHAERWADGPSASLSPLSLAAVRGDASDSFERWIRPERLPTDHRLLVMGVGRAILENGCSLAELRDAWRGFLGPKDVVAAWNQSTLDGLEQTCGPGARSLLLKAAYGNVRRTGRPTGTLEDVLRREGLSPVATPIVGRSGQILGQLLPMLTLLRGLAS